MATITYDNKSTLNPQPSVANVNKVTSEDMNEIKSVVNINYGEVGNITNLNTTNKTSVVNAINELKDAEIYSTTEVKTNKIWIDGKPIYRKVVSSTSVITGRESIITTGLSNVSEYIKAEGFLYRTNSTCFPLSRINPSNLAYGVGLYIVQNDNTIRIETGSNVTNISKVVVVLEYTKTTD